MLKKIEPITNILKKFYKKTLGFWLYKLYFYSKRRGAKYIAPWKQNFFEIFSKRSTLQIVFFIGAIILMFPYTKLHTKGTLDAPGTNTVLFSLAGPGNENFSLDEIEVDVTNLAVDDIAPWQQGSLHVLDSGARTSIIVPQEIATLGAGGSALQKPTIISSGSVPSSEVKTINTIASATKNRSDIVQYEVQSGDTIGRIAENFGISVETILWANNLTSRSYIRPGDKLKILPVTGVLHKVVRGDNLSKIANKYDAKSQQIIKANKLQNDGSDLIIGEELIIPEGRKQTTRIARTVTQSRALRNVAAPPRSVATPAGSGYIWPTPAARRITQYFGARHTGLDIAGPIGTPIYAIKDGRVVRSQCGWNGGYGCHVRIDHGGGILSLYAHSSKLLVKKGDIVKQGQLIALIGSTGRSTGPHVHFEIRLNGRYQNPFSYVR